MHILFETQSALPVKKYGGTERFQFWLMRELVRKGHKVTLISNASVEKPEYGYRVIHHGSKPWWQMIPKDVDVLHLVDTPRISFEKPIIVTIGGNGQIGEKFHRNTVFVSKSHAANHGSKSFVYNGIDLSEFQLFDKNRGRNGSWNDFLFLAKAKWKVKNLSDCIRVIKAAKKQLHVAGGRVLSFSRRIHSYGMANELEKRRLLSKMDALLFPVRWPEPFGIAIIEAMACGLPVIGSDYGSLPELIIEETGVRCRNYEDLANALANPPRSYDPRKIRAHVEKHFSSTVIAERYLTLYEKIMSGEYLNEKEPISYFTQDPQTLLPF